MDAISLTPSLKQRVIEQQKPNIELEDTHHKTYLISTLKTSPISYLDRDFGTISGIDDISFTPFMSKCMVNIDSNTSLIDED